MYCKNCGNSIDNNAIVCPHCGVQVGSLRPKSSEDKSNTIAIVGFVLSFFIAVAGLICSIIGYRKAVQENRDYKNLSFAGIIISCISIVLAIILYFITIDSLRDVYSYYYVFTY